MPQTTTERPGFTFEQIAADPRFRDLPYQIETNARGQIIMSPTTQDHGFLQSRIAILLDRHLDGAIVTESSLATSDGEKIADVAWCSWRRWEQLRGTLTAPVAPEICVEIRSPSTTDEEMAAKRALYVEAGAEEVWICDEDGTMHFFDAEGEMTASRRAPDFPARVQIGPPPDAP
jgi:Uma2 family endonuclease